MPFPVWRSSMCCPAEELASPTSCILPLLGTGFWQKGSDVHHKGAQSNHKSRVLEKHFHQIYVLFELKRKWSLRYKFAFSTWGLWKEPCGLIERAFPLKLTQLPRSLLLVGRLCKISEHVLSLGILQSHWQHVPALWVKWHSVHKGCDPCILPPSYTYPLTACLCSVG